jgi:hypothetical protein
MPNKTIDCSRPDSCPHCGSKQFYRHQKMSKILTDLKFMKYGTKRWIVLFNFHRYRCQHCRGMFYSEEKCWPRRKFGPHLVAYLLYQNIELLLSDGKIGRNMNKLFGCKLGHGTTGHVRSIVAATYENTYERSIIRLCNGRLLHVDETKVSVKGRDAFVWVLASMDEVAYIYRETRHGDNLHTLLKDFTGVLVSDFYAAYDSIQCPQQKCLIHLIRDLNDAVLKYPFDEELKHLIKKFADLVKPMIETVDRRGLKTYFLRKHLVAVDRFYRQLSESVLQSEMAVKCKERFEKNRNKLFTFLVHDGVPWNNNNAEHAIKAFAMLRQLIDGVTSEKGLRNYLIMLSIRETCKYQNADFLDFLRSGNTDVVSFINSKQNREIFSPSAEMQSSQEP